MSEPDPHLEALAEAIVFAHEADAPRPGPGLGVFALERTAALAAAAFAGPAAVPERLQRRLAAAGLAFCAERRRELAHDAPRTAPRGSGRGIPTFLLGVAAGIVVWFVLRPDAEVPIERHRDTLLATPSAVRMPWKAGPSPLRGQVEGDVVWSHDAQQGFLRFRGLPPLDEDHRFQLWIVDGNRSGAPPVDGGLFAVADAAVDTIVPIRAALPIGAAKAFVVTVEPRGGVVVSKQEHVVAIAGL